MVNKVWWERWPHILSKQLQELDKAGIKYSIVEKDSQKGILVLSLSYIYEEKILELEAVFPDLYPYFRFEVKGLNLELPRHQNPFNKNLCLIGRSTLNWDIDDTLADSITRRIPRVTMASSSNKPLPEIEEIQGEPISTLYQYLLNKIVLFDSLWQIDPAVLHGNFILGVYEDLLGVLEVSDSSDTVIERLDDRLSRIFDKKVKFRWVRCSEAIKEWKAKDFKKKLFKLHPSLSRSNFQNAQSINFPQGKVCVTGVLFPEEVTDRETRDGWVFLLQIKQKENIKGFRSKKVEKDYLLRPGRAGEEDMHSRIPELKYLKDKKIALFGLGCLGAPSALEFAKCGVGELRILDYDFVEPGTTVRWPLGLQATGRLKTDAIRGFINASYPYTNVISANMRIGETEMPQRETLERLVEGVDLIYDATAEFGVQYYLSSIALEKGIPYVCINTTYGAWGGIITRVLPKKTGCWTCLKHWHMQYEKDPEKGIPSPNQEEGTVQPKGCADPTFTGASFDGGYIALAGVRFAVSTLSIGEASGYPTFGWDVAVINLRDETGNAVSPEWKTFTLKKHPSCPCTPLT